MNPETCDPDISRIFDQLARSRRSIRGFLPDPVAQSVLDQVFETAAFAPSNCNTQPWYSCVVSGAMRDRLSKQLMKTIGSGNYALDYPYDASYEGIFRQRQLDVGILLYQALGVSRDDREGKRQAFLRNLNFFNAPHAVFIFMPEWGAVREACDVGMYAQNLMLAMLSHGLASCPQTILGYDAESVRRELDIEPDMKLLFGISFGYPDSTLAENRILPERARLEQQVKFFN